MEALYLVLSLMYIENALLRTHSDGPMEAKPLEGVWKYLDWIPTSISNEYVAGTTTYKAEALGMSGKVGGGKEWLSRQNPLIWGLTCGLMLTLAFYLRPTETIDFIYFRF